MAEARFDELVHAPLRLRICGLLRHVAGLSFARLRDSLGVSDATLSKHVKALVGAGYLESRKSASPMRDDSRRVVWLSLTEEGRRAFDGHVRALEEIVGPGHDRLVATEGPRRPRAGFGPMG